MKLADLDPYFVRYESRTVDLDGESVQRETHVKVETLAEAQGITFDCPTCRTPEGYGHGVNVTFADRGVADEHGSHGENGPSRWTVASGTGFADLTLTPSIDCTKRSGCTWHGYITNGDVT